MALLEWAVVVLIGALVCALFLLGMELRPRVPPVICWLGRHDVPLLEIGENGSIRWRCPRCLRYVGQTNRPS